MANQEHLDILKQGIIIWNQWRMESTDIQPDISRAHLSRANLSKADLRGTNLSRATLSRADLSKADLSGADLSSAYLNGADLSDANLGGTLLRDADLGGAHLSRADLSKADLSGALLSKADLDRSTLSRANLSKANLSDAHLSKANLRGADLRYANLSDADLRDADLSRTRLTRADLSRANLSNANLSEANISGAHLNRANLSNANLSEAYAGWTSFGDIDLSTVKGLETMTHGGPSTIGIDTLDRSKGYSPESFLRQVGIPDTFIGYMRSLIVQPIDFYTCFISYSSKDEAFAKRLYTDLHSNYVRCWFAPHDMRTGDKIRERIDETIRLYDKLLLILSEEALTSSWVEDEVEIAFEKELQLQKQRRPQTVLFPVRLDNTIFSTTTAWAKKVCQRHITDFTGWTQHDDYQKALSRLLRDLKTEYQKQE